VVTKHRSIKVAIIDNSIEPSIYKSVEHWAGWLDASWQSFRAAERKFPDWKRGFTHVILTGSEASIVEREAWVEDELEAVQAALHFRLPILGSCYGHQLLALALLGPAHVRRCAQPEVGWRPIRVLARSALLGAPRTIFAFSSHFDEVTGLEEDFRVLASSAGCGVQAFELRGRPAWGIQFHPEIAVPAAQEFLESLVEQELPTAPVFAEALRMKPRDSGVIGRIVRRFLAASPFS
jgi:GMP synthase-like glutamine amidotransferase